MIKKETVINKGDKVVIVKRHLVKFNAYELINTPLEVVSAYPGIVYVKRLCGVVVIPQGRNNLRRAYKRELI